MERNKRVSCFPMTLFNTSSVLSNSRSMVLCCSLITFSSSSLFRVLGMWVATYAPTKDVLHLNCPRKNGLANNEGETRQLEMLPRPFPSTEARSRKATQDTSKLNKAAMQQLTTTTTTMRRRLPDKFACVRR